MDMEDMKDMINIEAHTKVTELVGEMSFGVDIPSPIKMVFQKDIMSEPETISIPPQSMEPVFDAIYQKLKKHPDYIPFQKERNEALEYACRFYDKEKEVDRLEQEIQLLRDRVKELKLANSILHGKTVNEIKAEGIREAVEICRTFDFGKVTTLNYQTLLDYANSLDNPISE